MNISHSPNIAESKSIKVSHHYCKTTTVKGSATPVVSSQHQSNVTVEPVTVLVPLGVSRVVSIKQKKVN